MFPQILPLRAIVFQFLFLLIAIGLEAIVLHRKLVLDRKTSMQYSTSVNLLSTILGWIIFFNIQPFLPEPIKAQLLSYVFFDRFFLSPVSESISSVLIFAAFLTFFGTFLVKLQGLELLDLLLGKKKDTKKDASPPSRQSGKYNGMVQLHRVTEINRDRAFTVLLANACSFSAISLLLILRSIWQLPNSQY